MLELTTKQHEYILLIAEGPKTNQDIARIVGISDANVSKRVAELRAMGIVRSTWTRTERRMIYMHTLVQSYDGLVKRGFTVQDYIRNRITEDEIYYAAILTNCFMTGLQRLAQYQKLYPNRTYASLKNIIMKAKRRHLCR